MLFASVNGSNLEVQKRSFFSSLGKHKKGTFFLPQSPHAAHFVHFCRTRNKLFLDQLIAAEQQMTTLWHAIVAPHPFYFCLSPFPIFTHFRL